MNVYHRTAATQPSDGDWTLGEPVWLEAPGYHDHGGQRYRPIMCSNGSTIALVLDDEGDPECPANAALMCAAKELQEGCDVADSFMTGFEGDETQEGIDGQLGTIRDALDKSRRIG